MKPICFGCAMDQYAVEKILDPDFFKDRKEEFFPSNEFGDTVEFCPECTQLLYEYTM